MKIRKEVKVGIFALVTIFALYWGVNFLRGRDLFNRYNNYYAVYDMTGGIQKSSAITIKGFKIGVVSDISYDPQKSNKIVVEMNIRSKYKIPENSKARIMSIGLMSGKGIEIEYGDSDRLMMDGDTLRSEMEPGLLDMAGSEIELIKQKMSLVVDNLTLTLSNLNTLIETNTAQVTATINNISSITGSLDRVISSEEHNLRTIISSISSLSTTLSESSQNIGNVITNVESFSESLSSSNIGPLINNLSESAEQLNLALTKINNNEGTLGLLINNRELYDSLTQASSNLSTLLDDLQQNPHRYVQFSVFGGSKKDKK